MRIAEEGGAFRSLVPHERIIAAVAIYGGLSFFSALALLIPGRVSFVAYGALGLFYVLLPSALLGWSTASIGLICFAVVWPAIKIFFWRKLEEITAKMPSGGFSSTGEAMSESCGVTVIGGSDSSGSDSFSGSGGSSGGAGNSSDW